MVCRFLFGGDLAVSWQQGVENGWTSGGVGGKEKDYSLHAAA